MKYTVCIIFFALTILSSRAQVSVVYGEIDSSKYSSSVCFDKNGSLYPDIRISNTALANHGCSLVELLQQDPSEFKRISEFYNCRFPAFTEIYFQTLQDSIRKRKTELLKKASEGKSSTFLIHGFRKAFRDTLREWTSPRDYAEMQHTLPNYGTHFIEVYWDAQYGCCFSSDSKRNRELFRAFEVAQQNAILTGQHLQKLLSAFHDQQVYVISHSLGAKVAIHAVFGAEIKNLKLMLVAPAIGHHELIAHIQKTADDANSEILIIYNRKDFVLRKKDPILGIFGPGAYKFGNTSLGCNRRNAAIKAARKTKTPLAKIRALDMTCVGKCHHVICYFRNENAAKIFSFLP